jgi:hypothetical protein
MISQIHSGWTFRDDDEPKSRIHQDAPAPIALKALLLKVPKNRRVDEGGDLLMVLW